MGDQVVHHRLIDGCKASYGEPRHKFSPSVNSLLDFRNIKQLYSHQAEATDYARAGRNVVVATPTASGKTLTYNLPVIEQCLRDPDSHALYLFPLKALAQDQLKTFNEMTALLPETVRPEAAVYDGDTTPYKRKKIRDNPPAVILTNPEMLHLSMLPYHERWSPFLAGLTHIVVDEVHTYRGVMGSHMAMVFRRLLRICRFYGADPSFVFSSATVGNPAELCRSLTGLDIHAITESGAASGKRNFIFFNPVVSPYSAAIQLLKAGLARGLRTIVYTQSRKMTELISMWVNEKAGEYKDRISAYRAGFLPEERREIEQKMSSGELLAVISTSALELGIDIGGLDLCILVGYPGSVMATLQRGGRVGRSQRESAVILIAQEDALDQYFMRHPEDFFSRPPENAVLNPYNPVIMQRHLVCAACELTLRDDDYLLKDDQIKSRVHQLEKEGVLLRNKRGDEIYSTRKRPHREVSLRGAGSTLHIEDTATSALIGTIDEVRAYSEAHEGAVYIHRGSTYCIKELDLGSRKVRAAKERVGYYTRARKNKSTEILEIYSQKKVFGIVMRFGRLKVTEQVTGYEKRAVKGGKLLGIVSLDMPPVVFETQGLWMEISSEIKRRSEDEFIHFMGGIHAVEHAAIGILPLLVLTDRNDLGGISTPMHEQVDGPAVFIYDGIPGGAGLTMQAFEQAEELLKRTLQIILDCECELGCPTCVHSPKCGSGNRPIDKAAAIFVLENMVNGKPPEKIEELSIMLVPFGEEVKKETNNSEPKTFGVLDIETRRSAQDVGGWNKAERMGVSIAVLYDSEQDKFFEYEENQIPEMIKHLQKLELIIGFNIERFDYKVLSGIHAFNYKSLPTLDLLIKVHERLGYRLKLDNIAQATVNAAKSADGLQALKWWKEGRLDLITEYCKQDVAVTRDVYLFGKQNGYVLFTNKDKKKVRLPVEW
ncbi:DEAD/DEAH box helicase [Maridesulfovibrio hydrothermalis]|uniref:DEAD/DEAH box helicase domain protein n=1 Tax=Maridesulfovibrio hydrothermalis AM13 = DSM 14728 TaxID=1121451 RepID=L0R8Q9_9BACT|nr:DEAD/DEAH box helicase [Maridesulfovibrio hydrothermalis]CCO23153.1 DEAD/DEAH box helicase domain protein [Maridesulfovibrio hydrothermalis AM13 = DSM 14728]